MLSPVMPPRAGAQTRRVRQLALLVAICLIGLVVVYVVFIQTSHGQRFMDWALIGNAELAHARVRRASRLLEHLSGPLVALLVVAVLVIGLLRRRFRTALLAAAGFVVAVIAAEVLKRLLPRPLLDATWEQDLIDKTINTFPSGHVTIVTSFVLALVLVSSRRARGVIAAVGSVLVLGVGIGVVIAGWHRPGDSLGGALLGALVLGTTSLLLVRGRPLEPEQGWSRLGLALAAVAGAALVGAVLVARQPGADLPEGVGGYAFPVALIAVALTCFLVVQVTARLLCVPEAPVMSPGPLRSDQATGSPAS